MLLSLRSLLLTSSAYLHGPSAVLHAHSPALHASLAAAHAPQSIVQQHEGRMSKPAMCISRRSFNSLLAGVLSAGVFNVALPSKCNAEEDYDEEEVEEAEAAEEAEEAVEAQEAVEAKLKDLETEEAELEMKLVETRAALRRKVAEKDERMAAKEAALEKMVAEKEQQLAETQADLKQKVVEKEKELAEAQAALYTKFEESQAGLERAVAEKEAELKAARVEFSKQVAYQERQLAAAQEELSAAQGALEEKMKDKETQVAALKTSLEALEQEKAATLSALEQEKAEAAAMKAAANQPIDVTDIKDPKIQIIGGLVAVAAVQLALLSSGKRSPLTIDDLVEPPQPPRNLRGVPGYGAPMPMPGDRSDTLSGSAARPAYGPGYGAPMSLPGDRARRDTATFRQGGSGGGYAMPMPGERARRDTALRQGSGGGYRAPTDYNGAPNRNLAPFSLNEPVARPIERDPPRRVGRFSDYSAYVAQLARGGSGAQSPSGYGAQGPYGYGDGAPEPKRDAPTILFDEMRQFAESLSRDGAPAREGRMYGEQAYANPFEGRDGMVTPRYPPSRSPVGPPQRPGPNGLGY